MGVNTPPYLIIPPIQFKEVDFAASVNCMMHNLNNVKAPYKHLHAIYFSHDSSVTWHGWGLGPHFYISMGLLNINIQYYSLFTLFYIN